MTLAYDPQEYHSHAMLAQLLAEQGEHDAAAVHARKGLESYPEPIEVPQLAIALYRALARIVPRLRRDDIEKTLRNPGASNIEWFDWAKQYLHWYDSTYGGDQTPSQH